MKSNHKIISSATKEEGETRKQKLKYFNTIQCIEKALLLLAYSTGHQHFHPMYLCDYVFI